jgi:GGDEF domain-containing protein
LREYSGDEAHPLGISIGVAVTDPSQEEPLADLLARADGAMYVSKRGGKGRYALSSAPGQPVVQQVKKAV